MEKNNGERETKTAKPQREVEKVRAPRKSKKKQGNDNRQPVTDDISKKFPNFMALTKDERLAFFEALTTARKNVEKMGLSTEGRFGTVHDEYLEYFDEDSGQDGAESVTPEVTEQSDSCKTFVVAENLMVPEDLTSATESLNDGSDESKMNEPAILWEECETFLKENSDAVVDLYMNKKKRQEEELSQSNEADDSLFGLSQEEFHLVDQNSTWMVTVKQKAQDKENIQPESQKLEGGLKLKETPKFDALSPQEKEIFFNILKEAHDNILSKNPEKKNEIIPFESILKGYHDPEEVAVFATSLEHSKKPEIKVDLGKSGGKNLKLNLKIISVDNERRENPTKPTTQEKEVLPKKKSSTSKKPDLIDLSKMISEQKIIRSSESILQKDKSGSEDEESQKKSMGSKFPESEIKKKQRINDKDKKPEELKLEQSEPEESKPEEPKPKEPKPKELKPGESKSGEPKPEELKPEEVKPEEPKPGEPKPGEPKPGEPKSGEPKPEELKPEEPNPEEPKPGEPKPGEPKSGEPKPEEPKSEEPKPEEPKPKKPKPKELKPGEPKLEEPKPKKPKPKESITEEPKPKEPKPEESIPGEPLPGEPIPGEPKPEEKKSLIGSVESILHKDKLGSKEKEFQKKPMGSKFPESENTKKQCIKRKNEKPEEPKPEKIKSQNSITEKQLQDSDNKVQVKKKENLSNTDKEKSQEKINRKSDQEKSSSSNVNLGNSKEKVNKKFNMENSKEKFNKKVGIKDSAEKFRENEKDLKKFNDKISQKEKKPKISGEKIEKDSTTSIEKIKPDQGKPQEKIKKKVKTVTKEDRSKEKYETQETLETEEKEKGRKADKKCLKNQSNSVVEIKPITPDDKPSQTDPMIRKPKAAEKKSQPQQGKNKGKADETQSGWQEVNKEVEKVEEVAIVSEIRRESDIEDLQIHTDEDQKASLREKEKPKHRDDNETTDNEFVAEGKKQLKLKSFESELKEKQTATEDTGDIEKVEEISVKVTAKEKPEVQEGKAVEVKSVAVQMHSERDAIEKQTSEIKNFLEAQTKSEDSVPESQKKEVNVLEGKKTMVEITPINVVEQISRVLSLDEDTPLEVQDITIPQLEYKTGKVVLVGDDVIEKVRDLIQDLEKKAKGENSELENEYLQILLGYIDYLSKVLESLIEQKRKRKIRQTQEITAAEVHLKFDNNLGGTSKMKEDTTNKFPRSVSEEEIILPNDEKPAGNSHSKKQKESKKSKIEDKSDSHSSLILLSTSDSGSSIVSDAEERAAPIFVKKKRLPDTKIRLLQDLLKERAEFVEGSITDFKIVSIPEKEYVPKETTIIKMDLKDEEEEYMEKMTKIKFFRILSKWCRCGKKENVDEDEILENLKGEAVHVDVSEGKTRNAASATLNESTMEVLKAAERKKIIQKYWKGE